MQRTRRRFLRAIGVVAGSGLLAACGASPPPSLATAAPGATPTSAPSQTAAAVAKPAPSQAASPAVGAAASPAASPVANPAAVPSPSPTAAAAAPVLAAVAGKPIYQVDAQHTGRSPYAGPRRATVLRRFDTSTPELLPPDAVVPRADIQSSTVIGPDGTIYMLSGSGQLFAISAAGQTRWTAQAGPALKGSPGLALDGTVYQASTDGKLYAIAPPSGAGTQGSVRWTFDFGEHLGPTRW